MVNAVAVGQLDGRTLIVSGSDDGSVRVWDAATGTPVADPFTGHTGSVLSVAVGQLDGRTIIVSGSTDATAQIRKAAHSQVPEQSDVVTIKVGTAINAITLIPPATFSAAGELGIISMRLRV